MSRIEFGMTPMEMIVAMADGNPGAMRVMGEMFEKNAVVDPACSLGELGAIIYMDEYRIYGSRIWLLYKDVCKSDIIMTIAALRAVQLGLRRLSKLDAAIAGDLGQFNAATTLDEVRKTLHDFAARADTPR